MACGWTATFEEASAVPMTLTASGIDF